MFVIWALALRAAGPLLPLAGQMPPSGYLAVPGGPPAPSGRPSLPGAAGPTADPASLRYPLPPAAGQPAPTPPAGLLSSAPVPTASEGVSLPGIGAGAPTGPVDLFQRGRTVAIVGDKYILYGDVAPTVDLILWPYLAKATSDAQRQAILAQRELLTRSVLQQMVQTKMLYLEFERSMPAEVKNNPTKRAEVRAKMDRQIRQAFDAALESAREKVATAAPEEVEKSLRQDVVLRLAWLMHVQRLESLRDLDAVLRQLGSSLDQQVREFGEMQLGFEAARRHFKKQYEVTHQEMLDYYREHAADFYVPAKARFEILTVKFANFGGDRAAAWDYLARMGNEVLLGGTPFAAVARKYSQEPHAQEGGYYDWVTAGSLASKPLDQAIFSLEINKLSPIIEDQIGLHIVRVLERRDAGYISFQEAQSEIRRRIEAQKRALDQQKYLEELRARTYVWTIYDAPDAPAGQ